MFECDGEEVLIRHIHGELRKNTSVNISYNKITKDFYSRGESSSEQIEYILE